MFHGIKHLLNSYRRYYDWKGAGVIYIHVPKVAGTSINFALYGKPLGHYTARELSNRFPKLFDQCFTFSLVRNPWDRALSAYHFAKAGRTNTMGVNNPEQYQIEEFNTFEQFLLEWLQFKSVNNLDYIFQEQSRFLVNSYNQIVVDFVGRFEEIATDLEYVQNRIGRRFAFEKINSSNNRYVNFREAYKSHEMINVVRKVYANDIELFGYSFE